MSLDGFIAGPGHAMDWIFDFLTADAFPEVMAATGSDAYRPGYLRGCQQMPDEERTYEGGAEFVLTHEPPDEPDPRNATFLTRDIAEAVATALSAAGGKNLESSAPTWPASACSEGSSTRSWSMSYRCSWATGSAFRPRPSIGLTSNHSATPSRAPSPCSASACLAPRACSNRGPPKPQRTATLGHRPLLPRTRPELLGFALSGSRADRPKGRYAHPSPITTALA